MWQKIGLTVLIEVIGVAWSKLVTGLKLRYYKYKAHLEQKRAEYHRAREEALRQSVEEEARLEQAAVDALAQADAAKTELERAQSLASYVPDYGDAPEKEKTDG